MGINIQDSEVFAVSIRHILTRLLSEPNHIMRKNIFGFSAFKRLCVCLAAFGRV